MNKWIGTGRIVRDLELKQTGDNSYVKFTLANDTGYGEHKQTNFLQCIAWNKTAETICSYLQKGSPMIIVDSEIVTGSYEKKDGTKVYTTELKVFRFEFMMTDKNAHEETQTSTETSGGYTAPDKTGDEEPDDDLPF